MLSLHVDGSVYGIEGRAGGILWKHAMGSPVAASVCRFSGPANARDRSHATCAEVGVVVASQAGLLELIGVSQVFQSAQHSEVQVSSAVRRWKTRGVHGDQGTVVSSTHFDLSDASHLSPPASLDRQANDSESDVDALSHESFAEEHHNRVQGEVFASPVSAYGLVFVGSRDDNMYCFELA